MPLLRLVPSSALLLLVAACGTTDRVMDPTIEEQARQKQAAEAATLARQESLGNVLLNLDKTIDKYVQAVVQTGMERSDQRATGLERHLRRTVDKHFDELLALADDASEPANRAIALAALGFSNRTEALDPLLNGARSEDETLSVAAVFGLGMLEDRRTPPRALIDALEDASRSNSARIGAAWSLFRVQEAIQEPERVYPVWQRVLHDPEAEVEPWILVQALRGLSRSRNAEFANVVEPYLEHPTPLVRQMAAICLGYLGNRASHRALLACIGPQETNPNVRLAARKALQALAGNVDRGYNVAEWRRVFETSRDG